MMSIEEGTAYNRPSEPLVPPKKKEVDDENAKKKCPGRDSNSRPLDNPIYD